MGDRSSEKPGDQLSTFQYDGNGNPTTYANIPGMTFDPENHLTSVPGMMQAGYDSDDLRAWKQGASPAGPTPPTYFLYDGDTAIAEEDMNGNVLAWNGYGADGLRTRYTANPAGGASQTMHYAFDPSGNLANRLDPNGVSSNTTVFDAFGALRGQINASTGQPEVNPDPVGFSGQWGGHTDPETKLVLMTHRYYDPSHGRWLNRDPIGYSGGSNLYGYCGNNPVTGIDPDGYSPDMDDLESRDPDGVCGRRHFHLPHVGKTADDLLTWGQWQRAKNAYHDWRNHRKSGWKAAGSGVLAVGATAALAVDASGTLGKDLVGEGVKISLPEARRLVSRWAVDPLKGTIKASIRKHFRKHGAEVGAGNVWRYLRQAEAFASNLKGVKPRELPNGRWRYTKQGKYVILDAEKKIVSFGLENKW